MVTANNISRLLLRWHPADRAVIALLVLTVFVAAVRLPAVGPVLTRSLVVHSAFLAIFLAGVLAMIRWEQGRWVSYARPLLTVGTVLTLYMTLVELSFKAIAYMADAGLSQLDTWLFGMNPALFVERFQTGAWVEFFSFIYACFIPYIYLSLALGCLGRPPQERDEFLTGWVFTYAISYLGYIFVPAQGPVVHHAGDFSVSLAGGTFHEMVVRGIDSVGGPHGAFPSLHVGASLYLCLFDLQTNRLRGLTYLPIVLLIYVATIMLRYHYVVDLIAGTTIATSCLLLGRRAFRSWAQRRELAGLPALPGGDGDAVSILPDVGASGAAPVLSTH